MTRPPDEGTPGVITNEWAALRARRKATRAGDALKTGRRKTRTKEAPSAMWLDERRLD